MLRKWFAVEWYIHKKNYFSKEFENANFKCFSVFIMLSRKMLLVRLEYKSVVLYYQYQIKKKKKLSGVKNINASNYKKIGTTSYRAIILEKSYSLRWNEKYVTIVVRCGTKLSIVKNIFASSYKKLRNCWNK